MRGAFFSVKDAETLFLSSGGLLCREAVYKYQIKLPSVPRFVPCTRNQRYLEGAEEVRGGLAGLGWNFAWFIFALQLFLYGSFIFPVHDNLLCFVTSWIRLLHFGITCLLEMLAFVVTLGEFVTAVSKRILLNKLTAT